MVIKPTCATYHCKGRAVLHRYGFICSLFFRIPSRQYGSSVRRLHTAYTRRSVWSCVRPASAPDPAPRRTARKNSLTSCMLGITVYVHGCSLSFSFFFFFARPLLVDVLMFVFISCRCHTSCSTMSNDLLHQQLPYATVKCV